VIGAASIAMVPATSSVGLSDRRSYSSVSGDFGAPVTARLNRRRPDPVDSSTNTGSPSRAPGLSVSAASSSLN
jgi:hypothetical protein